GHLREMTAGSGLDAEIYVDQVPIMGGAEALISANVVPGGTRDNLAYVEPHMIWGEAVSQAKKILLADAQTSGGLLIAVPAERLEALVEALEERGVDPVAHIGQFTQPGPGRITVR
ncbi:MAG: hypothetical protein KAS19_01235, partial [Anaerolineales bacterium]|nr:hypothetical protein [Anaerolineales bacterium]